MCVFFWQTIQGGAWFKKTNKKNWYEPLQKNFLDCLLYCIYLCLMSSCCFQPRQWCCSSLLLNVGEKTTNSWIRTRQSYSNVVFHLRMIHPNVVVQPVLVNSLSSRTCPRRTVHAADFEQEQMTRSDRGLVGFEDHEVQRDRDQDSCRNCGRSCVFDRVCCAAVASTVLSSVSC